MKSTRLEDVLDNIGSGVHDVYFLDRNGKRLTEQDLKMFDFNNMTVIERSDDSESTPEWKIVNLHLDLEKEKLYMNSKRLQDVLDNIGSLVNDVYFLDRNGKKLTEQELKMFDFDNMTVIRRSDNSESTPDWRIVNLQLDLEVKDLYVKQKASFMPKSKS